MTGRINRDAGIRYKKRQPHHRWCVSLCLCFHPTANTRQFGQADEFLAKKNLAQTLSWGEGGHNRQEGNETLENWEVKIQYFQQLEIFFKRGKKKATFFISILFFLNPFVIRREWAEYVAADYTAVILGSIRNTVIFPKNLVITKLQPNLAYSEVSVGQIRFE